MVAAAMVARKVAGSSSAQGGLSSVVTGHAKWLVVLQAAQLLSARLRDLQPADAGAGAGAANQPRGSNQPKDCAASVTTDARSTLAPPEPMPPPPFLPPPAPPVSFANADGLLPAAPLGAPPAASLAAQIGQEPSQEAPQPQPGDCLLYTSPSPRD